MSIDIELERPKFEAWHRSVYPKKPLDTWVAIYRWQGWLAAKRDSAQQKDGQA